MDDRHSLKKGPLPWTLGPDGVARAFRGRPVVLSIWIAQGFLAPIGWAAVIAITTWPLYRRFTILLASQRDSIGPPLVFTLLIGLVLLVPVGLAAHRATQETEAIGQSITHYRQHGIP